jgi:NitT/TauT family transport system ATP-binding protein
MWKRVAKRLARLARGVRRARRRAARGLLIPRVARKGPPKIDVQRVGHRFKKGVVALRDVNIEVHAGEFV